MTPPAREGDALTERETSVLRGIVTGASNAAIGRELFVSEDTVKAHARRLYSKLGARDRAHAVAMGFARGLLDADRVTFEVRVIGSQPTARTVVLGASPGGRLDGEVMSPPVEHAVGRAAQQLPVGAP